MRRQPLLGVFFVEWPRRHDSQERDQRARKSNVQRQRDVLGEESDEEGDDL